MLRTIISRITAVLIIIVSVIIIYRTVQENNSEKLPETTAPIQIDSAEEFNGVLFGMTMEDVIKTLNSQPDYIHSNSCVCWYNNVVYLNVNAANMEYWFEDDKLTYICVVYEYSTESEKEQMLIDYRSIQEELLKRYPGKTSAIFEEISDFYYIETQNRDVYVEYLDNIFYVIIRYSENTETPDSIES